MECEHLLVAVDGFHLWWRGHLQLVDQPFGWGFNVLRVVNHVLDGVDPSVHVGLRLARQHKRLSPRVHRKRPIGGLLVFRWDHRAERIQRDGALQRRRVALCGVVVQHFATEHEVPPLLGEALIAATLEHPAFFSHLPFVFVVVRTRRRLQHTDPIIHIVGIGGNKLFDPVLGHDNKDWVAFGVSLLDASHRGNLVGFDGTLSVSWVDTCSHHHFPNFLVRLAAYRVQRLNPVVALLLRFAGHEVSPGLPCLPFLLGGVPRVDGKRKLLLDTQILNCAVYNLLAALDVNDAEHLCIVLLRLVVEQLPALQRHPPPLPVGPPKR